jgi:hypothetical protein
MPDDSLPRISLIEVGDQVFGLPAFFNRLMAEVAEEASGSNSHCRIGFEFAWEHDSVSGLQCCNSSVTQWRLKYRRLDTD